MKHRKIAFYLPQYYPTPYNDNWWGKGFTEWTNVGKAKPLFAGHHQPKVPSELGYYDLRLKDTRCRQADLAREYGIEGFCYWHYWFGGKRLLNEVFDEVISSKAPNFPICLCWANHSWYKKTWTEGKDQTLLIEQTYPGVSDYIAHFNALLPAFRDPRYMRTNDGKLIFAIFDPLGIPDFIDFKNTWNSLAKENGLGEFCFYAFTRKVEDGDKAFQLGYDATITDYINYSRKKNLLFDTYNKFKRNVLKRPYKGSYRRYIEAIKKRYKPKDNCSLCLVPNFDHSPRSGVYVDILFNDASPKLWGKLLNYVYDDLNYSDILWIKAWNEWGEGNYLEPDLQFGRGFLEELGKYK